MLYLIKLGTPKCKFKMGNVFPELNQYLHRLDLSQSIKSAEMDLRVSVNNRLNTYLQSALSAMTDGSCPGVHEQECCPLAEGSFPLYLCSHT